MEKKLKNLTKVKSLEIGSMTNSRAAILKPGKEKAILHHHHWIFSGAIKSLPSFKDGDILPVYSSDGKMLGSAYFNKASGIIGRMIAFDGTPPLEKLSQLLEDAIQIRERWFDRKETTAFRLVNGEGDAIPGLIADLYGDVLVLQSSTKGIDQLKGWIVDWFNRRLRLKTIYEKSLLPSRKEENLKDEEGFLFGEKESHVAFKENGLNFILSLVNSQKTGFFLDHREMRLWIKELSKGKKVLNAFSYTGGFSLYALAGGAQSVDAVDISQDSLNTLKKNLVLNGFSPDSQGTYCADVFEFLREKELPYDLVILDPPAFAKKKKDIIPACRGYKDINRIAMKKMPKNSLLLTCSCSHYVNEELFQKVLYQAAFEAGKQVRIIGRHRLAIDHPINVYHPESEYLKSFLLLIT